MTITLAVAEAVTVKVALFAPDGIVTPAGREEKAAVVPEYARLTVMFRSAVTPVGSFTV